MLFPCQQPSDLRKDNSINLSCEIESFETLNSNVQMRRRNNAGTGPLQSWATLFLGRSAGLGSQHTILPQNTTASCQTTAPVMRSSASSAGPSACFDGGSRRKSGSEPKCSVILHPSATSFHLQTPIRQQSVVGQTRHSKTMLCEITSICLLLLVDISCCFLTNSRDTLSIGD